MSTYYTGIGSRETPPDILVQMTNLAVELGEWGWTLRSGGAPGADTAFEEGASLKEIYLPWKGFNGNESPLFGVGPQALELAATIHPAWDRLTQGGKKLHARNCYQVMGKNLATPSTFVVCWTPGGKVQGGTATAIRLAVSQGIPTFNLALEHQRKALNAYLNGPAK